ncbi:unnamed protein product [Fraxinus pennsylvanica]|uniref:PTC1-like winged helix-turn-helix domain-containing protein n=1 Tax=Fraxinus pennsylvanica TaxID=56036 RepID=A0AAD2ECG9_9LAMI|nr:unnamed protein product [Fraxinus pennsylvanica]
MSNLIGLQGYTMHGAFHTNGFGHLLCINGLEMGSDLAGYQFMEFWDRLCTGLGAMKARFKDISQKKGMDLSLLHAVAYGDLLHFMLELKFQLPKDGNNSYSSQHPGLMLSDTSCRWSPKCVEKAIQVVIQAIKRAELRWVSRVLHALRRAPYIGDTGLLDFVLKSLGNHVVGKYLVPCSLNPVTKVLEDCLDDISPEFPKQEELLMMNNEAKLKPQQRVTWVQLLKLKDILVQKYPYRAQGND